MKWRTEKPLRDDPARLVMLGIGIGMLLEYVLMKLAKYYS
jgi:hypothetical protein